MGISIVTNTASLGAQRNLNNTFGRVGKNIERLSTGLRINTASDDAAGLGISSKLTSQLRSLSQAQRNANDGISLTQLAEGGLNEIQGLVTRARELAIQSANATLGDSERSFIQTEFVELREEIDRIANVSEFNGTKVLLSGGSGLSLQIGINKSTNDQITVSIDRTTTSTLGGTATGAKLSAVSLSTAAKAQSALASFDAAISQLSTTRARLGASQNRLDTTVNNLSVSFQNLSAANSRIRDIDVAEETADFTRNQIVQQAGVSVLAQANSLPQAALSLIG